MKLVFILLWIFPSFGLTVKDDQVQLDALDEYDYCQSRDHTGDACHSALLRWTEKHPDDAWAAGKMTRRKMNPISSLPFFQMALAGKKGDCGDVDVKVAVIAGLSTSGSNFSSQAKEIAFTHCFQQLKSSLVSEVARKDSNYLANSCSLLLERQALTGLKTKICSKQQGKLK